jgi:hypothetical protein
MEMGFGFFWEKVKKQILAGQNLLKEKNKFYSK